VLVDFLHANAEVFAWSASDIPGIPRDVAEHSLDIRAGARPVKQPLLRFDEEKHRAIGKEIHKLMATGFIKEVPYPLPRIDQIVDSTAGCEILSFLDAYSGYHQIKMKEVRPARDFFHHTFWHVLLYYYAIWFEECRCNIPNVHEPRVRRAHRLNGRGLR
jgi:hypothetical protein